MGLVDIEKQEIPSRYFSETIHILKVKKGI